MPIRVIAGSAKGIRLKMVTGTTTRPIMDRAKEALFSILGRSVIDATFLDLFAGTGSVGIEALSRGATQAVFVDQEKNAIQTIQHNLTVSKLGESAIIRRADVFAFLKRAPQEAFDFIYIAPPQYQDLWLKTLQFLDDNPEWILPETTVIVQIDPSERKDVTFKHLSAYDERRYGNTLLWFFTGQESEGK